MHPLDFQPPLQPDDPALAFAELRGEVSLLRRAIEGLTAERQNAPDYTATLAAIASRLSEIGKFMNAVAQSPAMQLTPDALAREIASASAAARTGDRENLDRVAASLRSSIASINGVVEQAWTADRQNRWLIGTSLAGALFGIVLWSVFSGVIARALPASWAVPEKMAARTLRMDMLAAGERLVVQARRRQQQKASTPSRTTQPTSGPGPSTL